MNRVGIITHYYDSLNYGGVLQAHALCRVLQQYDLKPEQICLPLKGMPLPWQTGKSGNRLYRFMKEGILFRKAAHRMKRTVEKMAVKLLIPELAGKRKTRFSHFVEELTPHSAQRYDNTSIAQCKDQYDIFITGSDQVWNLRWYNPAYFLTFVPQNKPKFSYGASMALREMSEQQKELFRGHLNGYVGISVRESQAADMLGDVLGQKVEWVLDPTLLLTKEQWDEVCAPRMVEEKYLFCYFLGSAPHARSLAKKFAKRHGLRIVTIPHLDGLFVPGDVRFGDLRLEAPSPEEFLSLVKHAECVFTDSFHATVFSSIYRREYFVFPRSGNKGMDDRIYSLTGLLGSESRFCDAAEKKRLDYLCGCAPLDHSKTAAMSEMECRSRQYLENCLEAAKEWMKKHEA